MASSVTDKKHLWADYAPCGRFLPDIFLEWFDSKDNLYFFPISSHEEVDGRYTIAGTLSFKVCYEGENFYLGGNVGESFPCCYNVKIAFCKDKFPIVYESGGRILDIADKRKQKPADFHMSSDGSCCLISTIEQDFFLKTGDNIEAKFIPELVIPFFVRISMIDKKIPIPKAWEEREHGLIGILQAYQDHKEQINDDMILRLNKEIIHMLNNGKNIRLLSEYTNIYGNISSNKKKNYRRFDSRKKIYFFDDEPMNLPPYLYQRLIQIRNRYEKIKKVK